MNNYLGKPPCNIQMKVSIFRLFYYNLWSRTHRNIGSFLVTIQTSENYLK